MRNWGEMISDILSLICKRVNYFEDLVAFGAVCSKWRHVAVIQNMGQPLFPLPWLMLAENQDDDVREFYSVTEGKSYRFELPELRGKMCMETKGWIVTASDKGDMALVHPLTHVTIPLPHQNTSKFYDKEYSMDPLICVQRVVLSSTPDPNNERDCVLMILHESLGYIGFCRPGDKEWTVVEKNFHGSTRSVEFYRGKFYVAISIGDVLEYDLIGKSNDIGPISPRRIKVNFYDYLRCREAYLVESAGSLLVVVFGIYPTTECLVLEIDLEHERLKRVTSLGTRSIFIGHSAALSVDTIFYPKLIPNSIYFTDDCIVTYRSMPDGGGTNMGIFNLEDKSMRPHYNGKSLSLVCPPVWTFLTTTPLRNR